MALIYAVEDDKNILEIEMFALKNSGYQVDGFECARDFYKKLDERQPLHDRPEAHDGNVMQREEARHPLGGHRRGRRQRQ